MDSPTPVTTDTPKSPSQKRTPWGLALTVSLAARFPVVLAVTVVLATTEEGWVSTLTLLVLVVLSTRVGERTAAVLRDRLEIPEPRFRRGAEAVQVMALLGVVGLIVVLLADSDIGVKVAVLLLGVMAVEAAAERYRSSNDPPADSASY